MQANVRVEMPTDPRARRPPRQWWKSIGGRRVVAADTIDAVVVRPDGYVFGTSDDPRALLSALRSMLSKPASVGAHSVASI